MTSPRSERERVRTIEAPSDHRSCALQSNDRAAEGPVDLGRDENFYGHPGEGAGWRRLKRHSPT